MNRASTQLALLNTFIYATTKLITLSIATIHIAGEVDGKFTSEYL